jgi:hypothetical protein
MTVYRSVAGKSTLADNFLLYKELLHLCATNLNRSDNKLMFRKDLGLGMNDCACFAENCDDKRPGCGLLVCSSSKHSFLKV